MKLLRLVLPAMVLTLVPGAWAQSTLYVDGAPTCVPPGTGTDVNPYCTIQTAYNNALSGDTISVAPGTYDECVRAADVLPQRRVRIVASAFNPADPNTANLTVIDSTGKSCTTGGGFPTGTVRIAGIGAGSSIEGFRIIGGGSGGLVAIGQVTITRNIIENNTAGLGAGMYLYPNTCSYGAATILATGNTIRNNTATFLNDDQRGQGGGVYVRADAPGGFCAGAASVRIENNTIVNNTADGSGAGVFSMTNTEQSLGASVVITQNTIDNNTSLSEGTDSYGDTNYGYGAGVYVTTFGYGAESIEVSNNFIRGNVAIAGVGGGVSANVAAGPLVQYGLQVANQTVLVRGNTVTGNAADQYGGGIDSFMLLFDLPSPQTARLRVENNTITGNSATLDGAGIAATMLSGRSTTTNAEFTIAGNRVSTNEAGWYGGGVEAYAFADADPEADLLGDIAPSAARIDVKANRIDDNRAVSGLVPPDGTAGGVFVAAFAKGEATATVRLERNTIANNQVDDPVGVGGVHVESLTVFDRNGQGQALAVVDLNSSILFANDELAVGGPTPGQPGLLTTGGGTQELDLNVDYSNFFNNAGGNFAGWIVPGVGNLVNINPQLNATTLVPAACSPTLDAGDPALDFSAETPPDGHRVNMGHTGGTAAATASLADVNADKVVDGVDVLRFSVAFGATPGQPRFDAAADFDSDGLIDGTDLAFLGADFGDVCP